METKNVTVVYDRKKRFNKTGSGKVEIVVYFRHNVRKYILVGEGSPSNWESIAHSFKVQQQVRDCKRILECMEGLGEEWTPENFNKHWDVKEKHELLRNTTGNVFNGYDQESSFIDYMKDCIEDEDLSEGTRAHLLVVVRTVHATGLLDRFCDLTVPHLIELNDLLLKDGKRTVNTVYGYHKKLKKYISKLHASGMIPLNPYAQYKFPKGSNAERRPLSEEELLRIRQLPLKGKLEQVRDLFIFAAYTGMAFCDVKAYDFYEHTDKVGDRYYIDGSRIKTGTNFYTPILPPGMEVLKKYNFKLPSYSNQKANDYLHVIEALLNLNKPLTFHVARHSFATLILSKDVPIENLARMLGHTEIRTTQIYAKILKSTIQRHIDDILPNLK